MQTSKISFVICALIACAPLTTRATDSAAQAAARAQVEAKLRELEAQSPETNEPTPVVIAPAVAMPKPAPTVAAPVSSMTTEPRMTPINPSKADKAAAKLKAKQDADKAAADLKAQKQAAKMEAARVEAENAAAKKQAAAKAKMASSAPLPLPKTDVGSDIGLRTMAAPALPIAASKATRLQALLTKYQADQISPEDYHKQRAAILAEP